MRLYFLTFLIFLLPSLTVAQQDELLWSQADQWSDVEISAGGIITIPEGITVILDQDTPVLGGLIINGTLTFAEKDLHLQSEYILVNGTFNIGSEENPFEHKAIITLYGEESDVHQVPHNGRKFLSVHGENARLNLFGKTRYPVWTRISETAKKGDSQLILEEEVSWHAGDEIVIASTDFDPKQAEKRTIISVDLNIVTLDQPLEYDHWGEMEQYGDRIMPMFAEVGLLTRNILIQGDEQSEESQFGGHAMVHMGAKGFVSGVEFYRMGQAGHLARYPFHWHLRGDVSGQYIRESSMHHSFQRAVTIHGTQNALVKDNVAYDIRGHAFFLEDAIESGNHLEGNLTIYVHPPDPENKLIPSDKTPAGFWITRGDNTVINNVAAGSDHGYGFWYDIQVHPTGPSENKRIKNMQIPLTKFDGNVTHSNTRFQGRSEHGGTGLFVAVSWGKELSPEERPVFTNLISYKNENFGAWLGRGQILRGASIADNFQGFFGLSSRIEDALIVGESNNIGNPRRGEKTGPEGRTLPASFAKKWPRYGIRIYDGWMQGHNITFANFRENSQRPAAAIGYRFPKGLANPITFFSDITLVNSESVFFDPRAIDKSLMVNHDGSLSPDGIPGSMTTNIPLFETTTTTFDDQLNVRSTANTSIGLLRVNRHVPRRQEIGHATITNQNGVKKIMGGHDRAGWQHRQMMIPLGELYNLSLGDEDGQPDEFKLQLTMVPAGSWIMFKIPLQDRWINVTSKRISQVNSVENLNLATRTAYFFDRENEVVYVKLFVTEGMDLEQYPSAGAAGFSAKFYRRPARFQESR